MSASGSVIGSGVVAAAVDHAIEMQRGGADGLAPLDGDERIPQANLPGHLTASELAATYATAMPLTRFGALGGPNVSPILAAAGASGLKDFYLPPGNYWLDEPWAPPAQTRWHLAPGATLRPAGDHAALQMAYGVQIEGGGVNCSHLGSFTDTAVEFVGHFPGGVNHMLSRFNFRGKSKSTGTAIRLHASNPGNYIDWVRCRDLYMADFGRLIHLDATTPGTWVNGNRFEGLTLGSSDVALDVEATGGLGADLNVFSIEGQAGPGGSRIIRCSGDYNVFDGMVFDVGNPGLTPVAAEFTSASASNTLRMPSGLDHLVIDNGRFNIVSGRGLGNTIRTALEPVAAFTREPSGSQLVGVKMVGDQDDWLAYVAQRPGITVTQTAGPVITSGSLASVFYVERNILAAWNIVPADPEIVIEVDLTAENMVFPRIMGLTFEYGSRPQKIKVELINGGATWTAYDTTTNVRDLVSFITYGGSVATATKLRLTMGNPHNGTDIRLNRWFGTSGDTIGKAWVKRHQPEVTGTTTPTAPAAGAAGALPAQPAGYYTLKINGTNRQIPYY